MAGHRRSRPSSGNDFGGTIADVGDPGQYNRPSSATRSTGRSRQTAASPAKPNSSPSQSPVYDRHRSRSSRDSQSDSSESALHLAKRIEQLARALQWVFASCGGENSLRARFKRLEDRYRRAKRSLAHERQYAKELELRLEEGVALFNDQSEILQGKLQDTLTRHDSSGDHPTNALDSLENCLHVLDQTRKTIAEATRRLNAMKSRIFDIPNSRRQSRD
ncbi:hypothetical protein BJ170DRAFT_686173 [Xylariales sp. AK1849]|nr:hypothetical protein BJ170DRAFT_686173 [Xylariales sp. AK1849]